jgi:hypothetical protein
MKIYLRAAALLSRVDARGGRSTAYARMSVTVDQSAETK